MFLFCHFTFILYHDNLMPTKGIFCPNIWISKQHQRQTDGKTFAHFFCALLKYKRLSLPTLSARSPTRTTNSRLIHCTQDKTYSSVLWLNRPHSSPLLYCTAQTPLKTQKYLHWCIPLRHMQSSLAWFIFFFYKCSVCKSAILMSR